MTLLGVFALLSSFASAQWTVGGGVGFYATSYNDNNPSASNSSNMKTFSLSFTPRIGYFLNDNMLLGLNTEYAKSQTTYSNSSTKNSSYKYSFGPYFRYIYRFNSIVGIWAEAQSMVGFGGSKRISSTPSNSDKTSNFSVETSIRPGISLFINKHLFFDTSYGYLGYDFIRTKNLNTAYVSNSNHVGLYLGNSLFLISLNYIF